MQKIIHFYQSTIGKKYVVALTGLGLLGFVVGHVVGNLKTFMGYHNGEHHLDTYAHFLREFLEDAFGYSGFLWILRIGLIGMLVLHVITIIQLQALNAKAKPKQYHGNNYRASSFAARYMMIGGLAILAFVVYHICHLTLGTVHPSFQEGKVYANVYYAFQIPWVTAVYCLAMIFLSTHLYHGMWSVFQTLGIDNPDWNPMIRKLAQVGSIAIAIGFMSVPIAVVSGVLPAPQ